MSTNQDNLFDFIKFPDKLQQLNKANELLHIKKKSHNKLIFVYSAPKVGSTAIVSSFRLFGIDMVDIIHIHDEHMLQVLANIKDVSVNEIILFNKYLGKDVYVINIYRTPIERKISTFFEKIGAYHFNVEDHIVNNYNITKVITRFNNIFNWIGYGDHFIDKYSINIPETFDFINKYLLVKQNNITYISLRLIDSPEWGKILSSIFGFNIHIIKDYESSDKVIKDLYRKFKIEYRIPINFLNDIVKDKYLNYYYSKEEINNYYNEWLYKSTFHIDSYNYEQYKLYETICIENCHIDTIQLEHYFDEGCICKACSMKRRDTIVKISSGVDVKEQIRHNEAKSQLIQQRINKVHNIASIIHNIPQITRKKNLKNNMKSILQTNK